MQYFEWYLDGKQNLWKEIIQKAEELSQIGIQHRGGIWIDVLGNSQEDIEIDEDGYGNFRAKEKSLSVWVKAK